MVEQENTTMATFKILMTEETGAADFPRRITAERNGEEFVVMAGPGYYFNEFRFYFEKTGNELDGMFLAAFTADLAEHDAEVTEREKLAKRAREAAERFTRFAAIREEAVAEEDERHLQRVLARGAEFLRRGK